MLSSFSSRKHGLVRTQRVLHCAASQLDAEPRHVVRLQRHLSHGVERARRAAGRVVPHKTQVDQNQHNRFLRVSHIDGWPDSSLSDARILFSDPPGQVCS